MLTSYAGAKLLFGGKALEGHTIPECYGAIEPTAVFVPIQEMLKSEEAFKTATTEVFGPLQVPDGPCFCVIVGPSLHALLMPVGLPHLALWLTCSHNISVHQ